MSALSGKDFFKIAADVAAQGEDHPLVKVRSPDGEEAAQPAVQLATHAFTEASLLVRGDASSDAYMLVCGSTGSGKSTLLTKYLTPKKDETPDPTVAMEYRYARHNGGAGGKDVAHIWEIGGDSTLSELLSVPITPQRLPTACAVVVVDLSKPHGVLAVAAEWLKAIHARAQECLDRIKTRDPKSHALIQHAALARTTAYTAPGAAASSGHHPDVHDMTPIMCPTLLVAAQYDEFRTQDAPRRKPVLNGLRYLAHVYGAAFMCTSTKEKSTVSNFKSWMNTALFKASAPAYVPDLSPANAVLAPEGADTFAQIGAPPGSSSPSPPSAVDANVAAWTTAVSALWSAPEGGGDDAADVAVQVSQHDEPVVDAASEELDRYKRDADRRLRAEAKAAARKHKSTSGGGGSKSGAAASSKK